MNDSVSAVVKCKLLIWIIMDSKSRCLWLFSVFNEHGFLATNSNFPFAEVSCVCSAREVHSEKFWLGCAARVFATIPLAMETELQNRNLGYGKRVKIGPLTIGNVAKLTTFKAICVKLVICFENIDGIRSSDNASTGFWPPGSLHTLGADGHI